MKITGSKTVQSYRADDISIIDRLTRISDAHWKVHDYKTGGTLPTQPDIDRDNQLALYHLAINRLYPQLKGSRSDPGQR